MAEKHKQAIAHHYDENWRSWDEVYEGCFESGDTAFEIPRRRELILGFLDDYAGERALRVLDLGCGTGVLLSDVLARGHEATGVDISAKMVESARKKTESFGAKSTYLQGDIESLPFESDSFDVVIASGVLSHQEDDRQALTEITRLLKRGGLVIVTLPNAIKLRNLFDPYYYLLVVRRLLAKWLPRGRGRGAGATEFVRGGTFTVRKYVYGRVRRLFERYSLRVTGFAGCGFGPFTVFRRRILPASQTARISDCIEGLSARRSLSFLKRCANTLVLQMVRDA